MPGKRKRRQTKKQILAKQRLKKILMENPEVTYDDLKKQDPEIFELLSPKQILGMIGYLSSPISKALEPTLQATEPPSSQPPQPTPQKTEIPQPKLELPPTQHEVEVRAPTTQTSEPQSSTIRDIKVGVPPSPSYSLSREGEALLERELWVQATPIVRKVILNPKIYLLYDYCVSELGFKGDIGDFVADCVEDFFNARNIRVKIVREREVA